MSEEKAPVELVFGDDTVDQEPEPDLAELGLLDAEPKSAQPEASDDYEGKYEERAEVEEADEPEQEAQESDDSGDEESVGEETEEEATDVEDDEEQADAADRPDPTIPKSRLDKEIRKRRDLEAELEEMKQMLREIKESAAKPKNEASEPEPEPEKPQVDYDAKILEMEKAYMEQLYAGETDEALKIRAEINRLQEEKIRQEVEQAATQTVSRTKEEERFIQEAERLQQEYPIFDPNADAFNQEALDYALQLRDGLIQTGKPIIDALREATELAALRFGFNPQSNQAPAPAPEAKPKPAKKNLQKKIEAANKQPPKLSGESEGGDTEALPDPTKMSADDWDKLPEEVQNKLLGII